MLTVYLKLKIALHLLYSNATSFEMLFVIRDCAAIGMKLTDFEGGKVDAVIYFILLDLMNHGDYGLVTVSTVGHYEYYEQ